MKNIIVLVAALFCLLIATPLHAQEDPNPDQDPEVEIKPSKGHKVGEILLFPLRLPMYALKVGTYPLLATGRFMERYQVATRIIDLLSNEEKTFYVYPIFEVGGGSGIGAGLGLVHKDLFHQGYKLGAHFRLFTDMDLRTGASFGQPEAFTLGGGPVGYKIFASFTKESDEDFFGIGNNSRPAGSSEFAFSDVHGGFEFDYNFASHWHLKPKGEFAAAKTKTSGGTIPPSVEALFPATTLVGFDRWMNHAVFGLSIAHDDRDNAGSPESGGLRQLSFYRYQGVGNSGFDFNQYGVELTQYLRLWAPRRVLVLHNAWVFQQETGTSLIPFYRLAKLDINSPLRSFDRGRFRDSSSVIFNVEYRYPIWDFIDGSLFVDTGRVFDDLGDFALKNFKYSVGGGIRVITKDFFLFRLQAAYGEEGVNVVFKATRAL